MPKFNTDDDFFTRDTQVFYCDMQQCSITDQGLFLLLNTEDCQRYVSFKKVSRKQQFGLARYLIKQVLLKYYDIPVEHNYTFNHYCEWVVTDTHDKFYISISHSKNIVAVAISVVEQKIGLDVEFIKDRNYSELINHFCSEPEKRLFKDSEDKRNTFYQLWTAKEAYIKAYQLTLIDITKIDLPSLYDKENQWHIQKHFLEEEKYCLSLLSHSSLNISPQKVLF
ncbi:4'-phosphopantetheinyl transferase family protein [Paraglaciecola sp. 2405UD69-4]|uniref:4'-phosphopantetheinyl transferase family protein n=1 Tax=Paraglaciecola sp. 2405UD69-4 TaxID=3391836 RepID=UPI0039C9730A